jgi:hypothetical protein
MARAGIFLPGAFSFAGGGKPKIGNFDKAHGASGAQV